MDWRHWIGVVLLLGVGFWVGKSHPGWITRWTGNLPGVGA